MNPRAYLRVTIIGGMVEWNLARGNRQARESKCLNSACITAPELLSKDVTIGRLTLNFFASVVPK